jgi:hypothetical protein
MPLLIQYISMGCLNGVVFVLLTAALLTGIAGEALGVDSQNLQTAAAPKDDSITSQIKSQAQEPVPDYRDPLAWLLTIINQIYHANLDELFPTRFLLQSTPSLDFYRLKSCQRKDVATCMRYGESTL